MTKLSSCVALASVMAGGIAFGQIAVVQPPKVNVIVVEAADVAKAPVWIGVGIGEMSAPLRSQLDLAAGEGLLLASVMPNGPAAKAGLQAHDVLLKVGETKIGSPKSLADAVRANGAKAVEISYLRKGKVATTEVTPAARPDDVATAVAGDEALQKAFEEARKRFQEKGLGGGWQEVGPGIVVPKGGGALPGNVAIRVEKRGAAPARIHVQRDGREWDVTENELDQLPEDLRQAVQLQLANGGAGIRLRALGNGAIVPGIRWLEGAAPRVLPGNAQDLHRQALERHEELLKRMEELRKSVEERNREMERRFRQLRKQAAERQPEA